jgi:hypothetical protein
MRQKPSIATNLHKPLKSTKEIPVPVFVETSELHKLLENCNTLISAHLPSGMGKFPLSNNFVLVLVCLLYVCSIDYNIKN